MISSDRCDVGSVGSVGDLVLDDAGKRGQSATEHVSVHDDVAVPERVAGVGVDDADVEVAAACVTSGDRSGMSRDIVNVGWVFVDVRWCFAVGSSPEQLAEHSSATATSRRFHRP